MSSDFQKDLKEDEEYLFLEHQLRLFGNLSFVSTLGAFYKIYVALTYLTLLPCSITGHHCTLATL